MLGNLIKQSCLFPRKHNGLEQYSVQRCKLNELIQAKALEHSLQHGQQYGFRLFFVYFATLWNEHPAIHIFF